MKVLILGAGYTGTRLARCLIQQQIEVVVTNRSGQAIPDLACPVLPFAFSDDSETLPALVARLTGITHLISTIAPSNTGQDPLCHGLLCHSSRDHESSLTLMSLSLQWVGYLSTTGVYGDTQGQWVNEDSPVKPGNPRSFHRVTIENDLLNSELPIHIFRLPGIYGPGRSIFERIKAGQAQNILKPGHVFSRIHVDDIVQAIWVSLQHPTPREIYNVADDEPSEPRNLLLEGSRLLGLTPPETIPFESAQLSPMGLSFWQECRRVSNQKLKQALGVKLYYPSYREGLRAILAEQSERFT